LKKMLDSLVLFFHMLFRHVDFPTELGLIKIGNPNENSPVIVSGNYIYSVKRLQQILKGFDCYLLVAKSSGSNIWCAAGMGEFSECDIVDIINFTGISDLVSHRNLIVCPTAAVGVDTKIIKAKTGWNVKWSPYHFMYLPEYLKNNLQKTKAMYQMPFPLRDRVEMALGTATMTSLTPLMIALFWQPKFFLSLVLLIFIVTLFNFIAYPILPKEKHFIRSLVVFLIFTAVNFGVWTLQAGSLSELLLWELITAAVVFISCSDMCGSTAVVKTTISHWLKKGDYESLFKPVVNPNRCIGCRKCIEVCPKDVYAVDSNKKVSAVKPDECFECLACVKQCDREAIYNQCPGRYKKDIRSIPKLDELMNRSVDFYTELGCKYKIENISPKKYLNKGEL
jgi:NAD-dependent dihydropyrimidine dehydrogenase PreA subunit